MKEYLNVAAQWLLTSGLRILLIVILSLIAMRIARYLSTRIFSISKRREDPEFQKRVDTLGSIIRYVIVFAVFVISGIMIMGEFGIQVGPVLAAAGIVGLAVGFGAQSLVQDIISGGQSCVTVYL